MFFLLCFYDFIVYSIRQRNRDILEIYAKVHDTTIKTQNMVSRRPIQIVSLPLGSAQVRQQLTMISFHLKAHKIVYRK
jgi:hypothetical protein